MNGRTTESESVGSAKDEICNYRKRVIVDLKQPTTINNRPWQTANRRRISNFIVLLYRGWTSGQDAFVCYGYLDCIALY